MSKMDLAHDRVQQLCDLVQSQALEPAQKKAAELIEQAQIKAKAIIHEAQTQAKLIGEQQSQKLAHEQEIANSALKQAGKMAIQRLRQEIETSLFSPKIKQLAHTALKEPKILTKLISAYVEVIKKHGISKDFSVLISESESLKALNSEIDQHILTSLREGHLLKGLSQEGIKIQLHDAQLTVDVTESVLEDLLVQNLRQDFRERFFNS